MEHTGKGACLGLLGGSKLAGGGEVVGIDAEDGFIIASPEIANSQPAPLCQESCVHRLRLRMARLRSMGLWQQKLGPLQYHIDVHPLLGSQRLQ